MPTRRGRRWFCARLLAPLGAQPFAETDDLGANSRCLRGAISQSPTPGPSLTRSQRQPGWWPTPRGLSAHRSLPLDQLVQACGLQHPQTDFRMRAAKLRQREAAQVEAAMDPQLRQHRTVPVSSARSRPQCDENHRISRPDRPDRPRSGPAFAYAAARTGARRGAPPALSPAAPRRRASRAIHARPV